MNVVETLRDLVAIDSTSARSNLEMIRFLAPRLERLGLCARLLPYTDDAGVRKFNLMAVAPKETKDEEEIELAFVGHTDTVPYDPNWNEALKLTEREGKLYGRGACDTKAFIAAALTAVEAVDLKRLVRPLALVFTADEEVGLLGAKRLAETRALRARYAIVGEPTSLRPMRAGKGYCLAEIIVKGREAHSAYPDLGSSAIFRAAKLIAQIRTFADELKNEKHTAFDPPYTTLNVGLIRGGTAKNVIPGECRFTLEWRPIPGQKPERLLDLIYSAIDEQKTVDPRFECEVDAPRADKGFETSPDSILVRLLERISDNESGTVAFGTEAAQMAELGAEAVVFGPGDIRVAHQTGEFVPVVELKACVPILTRAIEQLCK